IERIGSLIKLSNSLCKENIFGTRHYKKCVFVLTNLCPEIPDQLTDKVKSLSGSPSEIVNQLSEEGFNHFYVDGGKTIQGFLNAGLIQKITLTRIPVIIGDGIPLFGPVKKDRKR